MFGKSKSLGKVRMSKKRSRFRLLPNLRCLCPLSILLCGILLLEPQMVRVVTAEKEAETSGAGLFSWSAEEVNKTDGKLFSLMKQHGVNALYQNISTKNSRQEQMSVFVESAMEEGISVYYLTGDSSWALDPEGAKLCDAVDNAVAYNRRIKRKFLARREADGKAWETVPRLKGIVLDVEPYTRKEWDRDPDKVMQSFVSGMKNAYDKAKENDLEVILCIPWYYDKKGQTEGLEELIEDGCDAVLVMNYYRGAEIKNIATEIELVQKHGKRLITAYELQKADGRGIKEINTYYNSGFKALQANYQKLLKAYPGKPISMAYHDYRAFKDLVKKETRRGSGSE